VFSFGVILFEMLNPFKTAHERVKVLRNLREGRLPDAFVRDLPHHAKLIRACVSANPKRRPSAAEIILHEVLAPRVFYF
jgi:serine/threonine protein kinase